MSDFKQQVEEIVCQSICEPSGYIIQECNHRLKGQYCDFVAKFTDRILAAHNAELEKLNEKIKSWAIEKRKEYQSKLKAAKQAKPDSIQEQIVIGAKLRTLKEVIDQCAKNN